MLAVCVVLVVGYVGVEAGFDILVVVPETRRIEAAELEVALIKPRLRAIGGVAIEAGVPKRYFGLKRPSWYVSMRAWVVDAEAAIRQVMAELRVPVDKVRLFVDPVHLTPGELVDLKRRIEFA